MYDPSFRRLSWIEPMREKSISQLLNSKGPGFAYSILLTIDCPQTSYHDLHFSQKNQVWEIHVHLFCRIICSVKSALGQKYGVDINIGTYVLSGVPSQRQNILTYLWAPDTKHEPNKAASDIYRATILLTRYYLLNFKLLYAHHAPLGLHSILMGNYF